MKKQPSSASVGPVPASSSDFGKPPVQTQSKTVHFKLGENKNPSVALLQLAIDAPLNDQEKLLLTTKRIELFQQWWLRSAEAEYQRCKAIAQQPWKKRKWYPTIRKPETIHELESLRVTGEFSRVLKHIRLDKQKQWRTKWRSMEERIRRTTTKHPSLLAVSRYVELRDHFSSADKEANDAEDKLLEARSKLVLGPRPESISVADWDMLFSRCNVAERARVVVATAMEHFLAGQGVVLRSKRTVSERKTKAQGPERGVPQELVVSSSHQPKEPAPELKDVELRVDRSTPKRELSELEALNLKARELIAKFESQTEVAQLLDYSQGHISNVVNGVKPATAALIEALERTLAKAKPDRISLRVGNTLKAIDDDEHKEAIADVVGMMADSKEFAKRGLAVLRALLKT